MFCGYLALFVGYVYVYLDSPTSRRFRSHLDLVSSLTATTTCWVSYQVLAETLLILSSIALFMLYPRLSLALLCQPQCNVPTSRPSLEVALWFLSPSYLHCFLDNMCSIFRNSVIFEVVCGKQK